MDGIIMRTLVFIMILLLVVQGNEEISPSSVRPYALEKLLYALKISHTVDKPVRGGVNYGACLYHEKFTYFVLLRALYQDVFGHRSKIYVGISQMCHQ